MRPAPGDGLRLCSLLPAYGGGAPLNGGGGEPTALIRDGEAEFNALKKKKADLSRADIVKAIAAHPVLLQRPIVVAGKRAAIGRPPEAVLPLLK